MTEQDDYATCACFSCGRILLARRDAHRARELRLPVANNWVPSRTVAGHLRPCCMLCLRSARVPTSGGGR